jgi:hypothetical protein
MTKIAGSGSISQRHGSATLVEVAVNPVLLEAVVAHSLVPLVVERANSLPENVRQLLAATARVRITR